jgi:predicted small metal-binding protein
MTKVLKCRDAGVDCDFEARGATEEDILKQAAEHAKMTCPRGLYHLQC